MSLRPSGGMQMDRQIGIVPLKDEVGGPLNGVQWVQSQTQAGKLMRTNTLWPWPYQTILFEGTLREHGFKVMGSPCSSQR